MTTQRNAVRTILPILGLALLLGLGGCESPTTMTLTNVSDTYMNVAFFVEQPTQTQNFVETADDTPTFIGGEVLQVPTGGSVKYTLSKVARYRVDSGRRVHIKVQPVSPSWENTGEVYWVELLTRPPMMIVTSGTAEKLTFTAGRGAIAAIPDRQVAKSRYEARLAAMPPQAAAPETVSK